jgi:serine/threonine protein kinase
LHDNGNKKKKITFTHKLNLLMDIARGVDYLHGVAKIFHRDLKPSNCLVC